MKIKLECPNGHTEAFEQDWSTSTAMFFTPIVDAEGRQINHDPNHVQTRYVCRSCNAEFWLHRRSGEWWLSCKNLDLSDRMYGVSE